MEPVAVDEVLTAKERYAVDEDTEAALTADGFDVLVVVTVENNGAAVVAKEKDVGFAVESAAGEKRTHCSGMIVKTGKRA